ncbi:DUF3575 domain-containing protein [Maribacter sp. 2210JD10-5]|uniref:DUF3575 domain-containing protein n=1 Tax=Maribacter sp. 2210JD10-5 TaxID=3386272 RepID=UPI0039BCEF32
MRKVILLSVFLSTITLKAQATKNVESNLFKVNVLAPGISYELGVAKNMSLNFEAAIIPIAESEFNEIDFELFPVLSGELRYFTNFSRRIARGKNITGNSGNYISFLNQAFITAPILGNIEYDEPVAYLGGILYGIQRAYNKNFYFGVSLGPAFFTTDNEPTGTLYLDARIGWIIN